MQTRTAKRITTEIPAMVFHRSLGLCVPPQGKSDTLPLPTHLRTHTKKLFFLCVVYKGTKSKEKRTIKLNVTGRDKKRERERVIIIERKFRIDLSLDIREDGR